MGTVFFSNSNPNAVTESELSKKMVKSFAPPSPSLASQLQESMGDFGAAVVVVTGGVVTSGVVSGGRVVSDLLSSQFGHPKQR